jgi:hypothetical protein
MPRWSRLHSALLIPVAAVAVLAHPGTAQRTHDESRLVIGLAGGWIGGQRLWVVPKQPIEIFSDEIDTVGLTRSLSSNLTIGAQGVYFPSAHVGYTAEFTYIGLGTVDACEIKTTRGSAITRGACNQLNGLNRSASSVTAMGGLYLRPNSRAAYQPYLKALGGFALVPRSTATVEVTWGPNLDSLLTIYEHTGSKQMQPTGALAFGVATAPSNGYQLRVEFRETFVQLPTVAGPTQFQGTRPPIRRLWKGLPSLTVGFDIVLERRRGRRY